MKSYFSQLILSSFVFVTVSCEVSNPYKLADNPTTSSLLVCQGDKCLGVGFYQIDTTISDNPQPLVVYSLDYGKSWIANEQPSLVSGTDGAILTSLSCEGDICTAVGAGIENTDPINYSITSKDFGKSWDVPQSPPGPSGFDESTNLLGISCVKDDCVAVGVAASLTNSTGFSLSTADRGQTWNSPQPVPTPSGATMNGDSLINTVTCSSINCIAGGFAEQFSSVVMDDVPVPTIAISPDFGLTWTNAQFLPLPTDTVSGIVNSIFCKNDNCIAVGQAITTMAFYMPYVVTSADRGLTWINAQILPLPSNADPTFPQSNQLTGLDCINEYCVATGYYAIDGMNQITNPLTLISEDLGITWRLSSGQPGLLSGTSAGVGNAIRCRNTECLIIGVNFIIDFARYIPKPYSIQSADKGETWLSPVQPTLPASAVDEVGCLGIFGCLK